MTIAGRSLLSVAAVALALVWQPAPVAAQESAGVALSERHVSVFDYRSIGPTRQSGRFVDIAVPRQQPHTFYMATASGNLWKTENRGITFEVLFEQEDVFSIGAIEVAPSDPNVLYLGSGEGNNSRSSYWGDGVYRSDDAGESWTNVGLPESHHIGRIVVHPEDANTVYVAALGHLYSENEERGLYKTTNGGQSWRKVLGPIVRGKHIGVVDVVMDPTNPDILYAATFDKVRVPYSYDLGGPGSRIYKTTDGGDSWQMLENGLPGGMLGRIGIAIYERDPNILYATIENANKEDMSDEERYQELLNHESSRGMIGGEVYRSDDAGASWRKVNPDDQSVGGQPAYYYGQIIIDPNDPDRVWVLSIRTWSTEDGGETWEYGELDDNGSSDQSFGGDNHALWVNPDDSDHMILGYDHGMGITYDGGENWYHPDFQSLAQFYAVGFDNSYPYRVAGGLQDNGSHMAYSTNPSGRPIYFEQWGRVGGGDGMYNEFDHCTGRYLYNESQFGPIRRLDLETGESVGIRHDDGDLRWNWMAPIQVSPHDCAVILHGANRLLRSENRGESWEYISPDLTKADAATLTTGKGGDGNIQYATITTFDQSDLDADIIWVGTDDGNVQVTRDGGETWTLLNANIPGNPEYWVSRVEASHTDPGTAYVSMTGYRRDDFRPLVWMTDDFGESWTDISSNLPDGPINVVREHPHNPDVLFVGTEFQVWMSADRGGSWLSLKGDMPTNPVHDLKIHPRENDLIVATHGRGLYIADIAPLREVSAEVVAAPAHLFEPEDRVRWEGADFTNYAFHNYEGESEPQTIPLYYNLSADAGEVTLQVHQGNVVIAELEGDTGAGMHVVHWEMDRRRERSEDEIDSLRRRAERAGREVSEEELRYATEAAPVGSYRVVMMVDGREVGQHTVRILRDQWRELR
jgi:photosystem II stability/assembly factor-like uncharacterized protein